MMKIIGMKKNFFISKGINRSRWINKKKNRNSGIKNNEDLLKTIPLGYLKIYNNDPCQKSSEYKYD